MPRRKVHNRKGKPVQDPVSRVAEPRFKPYAQNLKPQNSPLPILGKRKFIPSSVAASSYIKL